MENAFERRFAKCHFVTGKIPESRWGRRVTFRPSLSWLAFRVGPAWAAGVGANFCESSRTDSSYGEFKKNTGVIGKHAHRETRSSSGTWRSIVLSQRWEGEREEDTRSAGRWWSENLQLIPQPDRYTCKLFGGARSLLCKGFHRRWDLWSSEYHTVLNLEDGDICVFTLSPYSTPYLLKRQSSRSKRVSAIANESSR